MERYERIAELAIADLESHGIVFSDRFQAIKQAIQLLYDVVDYEDISSAELLAHIYRFYQSETVIDLYNIIDILVDSKKDTNSLFEEVMK